MVILLLFLMIDTTEEIKQNDLDIWLEDRISEALS